MELFGFNVMFRYLKYFAKFYQQLPNLRHFLVWGDMPPVSNRKVQSPCQIGLSNKISLKMTIGVKIFRGFLDPLPRVSWSSFMDGP